MIVFVEMWNEKTGQSNHVIQHTHSIYASARRQTLQEQVLGTLMRFESNLLATSQIHSDHSPCGIPTMSLAHSYLHMHRASG